MRTLASRHTAKTLSAVDDFRTLVGKLLALDTNSPGSIRVVVSKAVSKPSLSPESYCSRSMHNTSYVQILRNQSLKQILADTRQHWDHDGTVQTFDKTS